MNSFKLIKGGIHTDSRGTVSFVNDFDFGEVKRFYQIINSDLEPLRAWQAHKFEKKWFFVAKGEFEISLVKIKDWNHPERATHLARFQLSALDPAVLYVPGGYANSLKSLSSSSVLQVYSNFSLEEANNDQFRFPVQMWH